MKFIFLLAGIVLLNVRSQAQPYVFVFLNNKPDKTALTKEEGEKIMEGHMANINRLAKEGKLISAGPFDGGGGMFIFNATTVNQANEWLQTDPGVKANRWDIEMFTYSPHIGAPCAVKEPYHMVSYDFVRYTVKYAKYNLHDAAELIKKHTDYLAKLVKGGDLIAEGSFGDDGGIIVVRGKLQKDIMETDPGVADGLYQIEYKKLYIAEGAFCEKP